MVTTKPKSTFTCSSCKANHVQWMGRCHFCKSWNTITEVVHKSTKSDLDIFFLNARDKMTGKCQVCGGRSEKNNDSTYKRSIAHLLAKRKTMFPSVATHPDNWLELCHYGNSCHTNFDNNIITLEYLEGHKIWDIITKKFIKIYPYILESEKKNLPLILEKLVSL